MRSKVKKRLFLSSNLRHEVVIVALMCLLNSACTSSNSEPLNSNTKSNIRTTRGCYENKDDGYTYDFTGARWPSNTDFSDNAFVGKHIRYIYSVNVDSMCRQINKGINERYSVYYACTNFPKSNYPVIILPPKPSRCLVKHELGHILGVTEHEHDYRRLNR